MQMDPRNRRRYADRTLLIVTWGNLRLLQFASTIAHCPTLFPLLPLPSSQSRARHSGGPCFPGTRDPSPGHIPGSRAGIRHNALQERGRWCIAFTTSEETEGSTAQQKEWSKKVKRGPGFTDETSSGKAQAGLIAVACSREDACGALPVGRDAATEHTQRRASVASVPRWRPQLPR